MGSLSLHLYLWSEIASTERNPHVFQAIKLLHAGNRPRHTDEDITSAGGSGEMAPQLHYRPRQVPEHTSVQQSESLNFQCRAQETIAEMEVPIPISKCDRNHWEYWEIRSERSEKTLALLKDGINSRSPGNQCVPSTLQWNSEDRALREFQNMQLF